MTLPDFKRHRGLNLDFLDECDDEPSTPKAHPLLGATDDSEGGWFAGHVEATGRPRPPRHRSSIQLNELQRMEVSDRLASWASKYKGQLAHKASLGDNKLQVSSMPNLSKILDPRQQNSPARTRPAASYVAADARTDEVRRWTAEARSFEAQRWSLPSWWAKPCGTLRRIVDFLLGRNKSTENPEERTIDENTKPVLIFDWDDTLLPTSFITENVVKEYKDIDEDSAIEPDSPFYEELSAHAHLVEFVLRKATELTRVVIVTLSMDPWVAFSARHFLPGLDIERLLLELDIPVYYSRPNYDALMTKLTFTKHYWDVELKFPEQKTLVGMSVGRLTDGTMRVLSLDAAGFMASWNSENDPDLTPTGVGIRPNDHILKVNGKTTNFSEEFKKSLVPSGCLTLCLARDVPDFDPHVEAKRLDMEHCLGELYGAAATSEWNVISIGDSIGEQQALKEIFESIAAESSRADTAELLCKTVNLLDRPNVEQLSNELKVLLLWLPKMVHSRKPFDWAMNKSEDLERKLLQLDS